jgi:hypothetical protein
MKRADENEDNMKFFQGASNEVLVVKAQRRLRFLSRRPLVASELPLPNLSIIIGKQLIPLLAASKL